MKNLLLACFMLSFGLNALSQNKSEIQSSNSPETSNSLPQSQNAKLSFDEFCQKNACTVFQSDKSIAVDGTINVESGDAVSPATLGITLLEEKAQVYQIAGKSNTYVKVESIYRLRLMYNASQKN